MLRVTKEKLERGTYRKTFIMLNEISQFFTMEKKGKDRYGV